MKSEPEVFSLADLQRDRRTPWTGVRNYQARNFMRDAMRPRDRIFFYHSNCDISGIAGLARVAGAAYPDPTQFDPASPYFDPRATPTAPVWMLVDVAFESAFPRVVSLETMRADPELSGLLLLKRGMRLSIQPVEARHAARLLLLGGAA